MGGRVVLTSMRLGPVFLSASNYIGLDHIMASVGYEYARFKKWIYLTTFICTSTSSRPFPLVLLICTDFFIPFFFLALDILSLAIQAGGGGSVGGNLNGSVPPGMYIALGGIVLQLLATILYLALLLDFVVRHYRTYKREEQLLVVSGSHQQQDNLQRTSVASADTTKVAVVLTPVHPELLSYGRWTTGIKLYISAATFSSLCLIVRCVYRAAEMSAFSDYYLFVREWYLCVFDAVPVSLGLLVSIQALARRACRTQH